MEIGMTKEVEEIWYWWAGRDEEYLTIGPCVSRDEAICEAVYDIGKGEGDFTVMEGLMGILTMSADNILDRFITTARHKAEMAAKDALIDSLDKTGAMYCAKYKERDPVTKRFVGKAVSNG